MYQDVSVEGGRSDFDDKSVLEESVMASSAEPTAAGQSAAGKVKTGKLGKHTNTTLYIVALLSS